MIINKEVNVDVSYLGLDMNRKIAVVRWEIDGVYYKRKEHLNHLINHFFTFSTKNKFNIYVAVGDDNFNENNRIVNFYKLWKSLAKQKLEVKNGV